MVTAQSVISLNRLLMGNETNDRGLYNGNGAVRDFIEWIVNGK